MSRKYKFHDNDKLYFIHLNPVMAGFVINPEDWKYSSVQDFSGMKGLIELDFS